MALKNSNILMASVLEDIRKVVAENAEACGKAKDSISSAVCIFIPEAHRPTRDFQVVKR